MKHIMLLCLCLTWFSANAQPTAQAGLTYVCPACNSQCDTLTFNEPGHCPHCGMPLITEEEADTHQSSTRKKIAFYLQDGVEVLDFAGPMEVFSYAGYDVFTVSKTKEPILAQGIVKIVPDYSITDAPHADILAFFGGNSGTASGDPDVIHWVQSQKDVEYYLSVCTGAFILAESGILNGKTATTFHNALDKLEQDYPKIKVLKNVRFVDNGHVITTAGISAGIDGALHLVARLDGFNAARKAAYYMEYDKWVPGEGLILARENPYENMTAVASLEDYTGTYEFRDKTEIQIKVNEREKSLEAIVAGRSYPLFYLKKDVFTDVSDQQVTFERDKSNKITGYNLPDDASKTYNKLE